MNPANAGWHAATLADLQAIKAAMGSRKLWINSDDVSASGYGGAVDGFMIENFGTGWNAGQWMSQSEIQSKLGDIDAKLAAGGSALLVGQGAESDTQEMRFSHALYLLVAAPSVSSRFGEDYTQFWDSPEYGWDLGAPSGTRFLVNPTTYERDFANGKALADMSGSNSVTVNLGASYLLPDGSSASSVTLGPHEGVAVRR